MIAEESGDVANCVLGESPGSMPQFIIFQVIASPLPDGLDTMFSVVGDIVESFLQVPPAPFFSLLCDGL